MEGNDCQTAAQGQTAQDGIEEAAQFAQLVVDGHAQGLEGARGRMAAGLGAPRGRIGLLHQGRQLGGGIDGAFLAGIHDGPGYAPGLRLLAQGGDAFLEAVEILAIDPVPGRGRAGMLVHAHVQRPVPVKAEAALRLIQLQRGDADIQQHGIDLVPAQVVEGFLELAVAAMVGMDAPAKRLQPAPGQFQGFLVPVQGAEFRLGGRLQHGRAVPGHAERAVQDAHGAIPSGIQHGLQGRKGFLHQDRDVQISRISFLSLLLHGHAYL